MAARGETVAEADFPLYVVRALGNRHLFIAGGGGKAKTGVANAFEIFDIENDEGKLSFKKVKHYETGTQAIMNASLVPKDERGTLYNLAAGLDGECELFELRSKVVAPKPDGQATEGVRKRKGNLTKSAEYDAASKVITFEVDTLGKVETDFDKEGGFQKAVAFTKDLSLMATGGADGYMRVWQHPTLKKLYEIRAHDNEIDDLDISIPGNKIVTVSRDSHAYCWNTKDGSKSEELHWPQKTNVKYRFRHCRFTVVSDKKDTTAMFTTHVPAASGGGKGKNPCYLTKWDAKTFTASRIQSTGTEIISAFAVNDDGVYLGVGSVTGSVSVYIAFHLQKLYDVKQSHNIFVTSLDFAPTKGCANSVAGAYDFSLFSISVDKQIKLHQVSPRALWSPLWALAGFIIIIYLIYWLLTTYQL